MKMDILKQLPLEIQEIIYNDYLEKQREYHIYCNRILLKQDRWLEYQAVHYEFTNIINDLKEELWIEDDDELDDSIDFVRFKILEYNCPILYCKKYGFSNISNNYY